MNILDVGPHGLYVWGSLAMCAAALVIEVMVLRARTRSLTGGDSQSPGSSHAAQTPGSARPPPRLTQESGRP